MSEIGPIGTPGSWGADSKGSSASRHARRSEDVRNLKAARDRDQAGRRPGVLRRLAERLRRTR